MIHTIVDIAPDALSGKLSIVLNGKGTAWFDDVRVEILGPTPTPVRVALSSQQIENLEALTRAIALVRYRHPSDQSAKLDWDAFIPEAVTRVLSVSDRSSLLRELRALFKDVAPTVELSESPRYSLGSLPRAPAGHLVRWRHFGLGPSSPYTSWREGRDADRSSVRVEVVIPIPGKSSCKKAVLRAGALAVSNDGEATIYAEIAEAGDATKLVEHRLKSGDSAISVDIDIPSDAYNVRLGVKLTGLGGLELKQLSLSCGGGGRSDIDIEHTSWSHRGTESLFSYTFTDCARSRCLAVRHQPLDTDFVPNRDLLDVEIFDHLWIHVPLAVWTDGKQTLPESRSEWKSTSSINISEMPTRLAVIVSAWGILSLFYPYFSDLHIDWQRELPIGLRRMAATASSMDTIWELYRLLAKLQDGHARVFHSRLRIGGVLPISLRRFDDKVVVVGVLDDYAKQIAVGSEVVAIDDVSAQRAYDEISERMPSATAGWSTSIIPFWLTTGAVGALSSLQIKKPDGSLGRVVLPHLSRDLYESSVREARPVSGAKLADGVYYVDLEQMKKETWQAVLPALTSARVIILDMRGYPSNMTFGILGHFSDHEMRSPEWQYPILGTGAYKTTFWTIRPMQPKLGAKVICLLDGRAISAAETVLQIIRENHLATLVGETSAGTNGNVNEVSLPGGLTMRFTGMRVPLQDGTALHGVGIVPDHVVHPTLDGVRAGRDEILDAALNLASRL